MMARSGATLALALTLLAWPIATVAAEAEPDAAVGHVYVLNNNLFGTNSISVFNRLADGTLSAAGITDIGGAGSLAAFSDGTQGSLIRTRDGKRLFAVDAGSNQISVLDVDDGHLSLAGVFPSGGAGPVSLTFQGGLLYVLNAANADAHASANVTGFRVDPAGGLHPIAGSKRPLSSAHPNAAQVQLDPSGRTLLVTEKGSEQPGDPGRIDIYSVADDGSLSGPTVMPPVGAIPFGMAFASRGAHEEVVISDVIAQPDGTGGATAYRLKGGTLTAIGGPVPDHQVAPCWMVITRDGRFAFTSDADSHAISGYSIGADGSLRLLDSNGATAMTPSDTFPLEEGLSRDSHFLYVLDSRLLLPSGPGPATLSGFQIDATGHLTSVVDPNGITLPFSAIGLAAD